MRTMPALSLSALRIAAAVAVFAAPLLAQAEERGPGEIGHFVAIMTLFSLLFLSAFTFAAWLVIARLRSRGSSSRVPDAPPNAPVTDLEPIWFPTQPADPRLRRPPT